MTLDALIAQLERRADESEAISATAPVASVLRAVVADLRAVDGSAAPATSDSSPARLLTVAEAATLLQVSPKWVYRHRLPFVRRVGRALRVDPAALDRWLARRS